MTRPRVLVCDDKENLLKLFQRLLPDERFDVTVAADGTRALSLLAATTFDVVVTDLRMPGADGLTVLREARARDPEIEVVMMTAYATVADAVEAMKQGAYDYLTKPFEPDEAVLVIERALERRRLRAQARELQRELDGSQRLDNLVVKSPAMDPVLALIRRAAATDVTVLLTGESGTGKEVVARALHASGSRAARRFVAVNCGAIPEALLEGELFGHVKGSFTGAVADRPGLFEEARQGTIFLDEIGEMPLAMQVKLNRALQERAIRPVGAVDERPIDVRVIAATNQDLRARTASGQFREDLFYRLDVFPIHLPPLRDRREDIPTLAAFLLSRHQARRDDIEGFTPDALSAMVRYDWPGNVRELENVVERAIAVTDGPRIDVDALPDQVASTVRARTVHGGETSLTYREIVDLARDRASREYLIGVLREVGGNVTEAARRAGMERESLHRLLRRYRVRSDDFKPRT